MPTPAAADSVLYVGGLTTDDIENAYGNVVGLSTAGQNKVRRIIQGLQHEGYDVTVVAPLFVTNNDLAFHPGRRFTDPELGVKIVVPPTVDISFLMNYFILDILFSLLRVLVLPFLFPVWTVTRAAGGHDVVMAYNFLPQTAVPAVAARSVRSVPAVLEYEDGYFVDTDRVRRTQARLLRRALAARFDGAVCVNRPLAESLSITNTTVIRGYPSVGMPADLPDAERDDERTAVMFAGSFDTVRGVDWFIDVAEAVLAEREDVVFWISGYGGRTGRIRKRVAGVDGVRFFGTLPWEAYRARLAGADVFLNTQRPDRPISEYTFPSKILDFATVGVPIVTTDMADLRQELDDVLIVDGRTPESVVETLSGVLDEYQRYTEYGERAREWVTEECSTAAIGRRVDCVITRSLD